MRQGVAEARRRGISPAQDRRRRDPVQQRRKGKGSVKRQPEYVVEVVPSKMGGFHWSITVLKDGAVLLRLAKDHVVAAARELARQLKGELVVKDRFGRFQKRDRHGNDPRSK